mmetsp:Transcript_72313/g.162274  ORF Transcript_72313/g.162274 Transcript_72313/m.162274 type:complete len:220 (-) Transcript_72313:315-974(-)
MSLLLTARFTSSFLPSRSMMNTELLLPNRTSTDLPSKKMTKPKPRWFCGVPDLIEVVRSSVRFRCTHAFFTSAKTPNTERRSSWFMSCGTPPTKTFRSCTAGACSCTGEDSQTSASPLPLAWKPPSGAGVLAALQLLSPSTKAPGKAGVAAPDSAKPGLGVGPALVLTELNGRRQLVESPRPPGKILASFPPPPNSSRSSWHASPSAPDQGEPGGADDG